MKVFSLFSGIGGFDLSFERQGHEIVGHSEIDKYADKIYLKHFKNKNYGDIRKINTATLPDFDCLVGGFPCQPFSIAGSKRGFKDTRGTLFFEITRILRDKRPRYFVLENVKGLLSHDQGNTFKTIIAMLDELGYFVEWQVLNSKDFGVPQNRERVFIVGHFGGIPRHKVFPLTKSNRGNDTQIQKQEKHALCITAKSDRQDPTAQTYLANCLTATNKNPGTTDRSKKYDYIAEVDCKRKRKTSGVPR